MKELKVSEFADVVTGGTPSTSVKEYWENGNIPWLNSGELNKGYIYHAENFITEAGLKSSSTKMMPADTVLIALTGATCGLSAISKIEACANQSVTGILPSKNHVPEYLFHYLKTQRQRILDKAWGNAQPHISQAFVKDFKVPLPSLPDQLHIANILSKAENLIARRKESIRLLDEFLKSTFLEMFGECTKNEKNWEKIELKYFGEVITGNTPPRNNEENYSSNFIEWIKTDNIPIDNTYVSKAVEYLSESGLKYARTVEAGALLVACIAGSIQSVGRAALTDRKVSFNQQINAIQPNEEIEPLFLYWLFKISRKYIQDAASNGMKKILTKGGFEKIKMIKPPFELQTQFAQIVEKTESLKRQYQQSLQELENLYGSLSQRAFRGEMVIKKSETKFIALAPETKPVQPELNKQQAFLRKLMLASHIIYELCEEPTFGHTKLMKLLYLSEQAGGMALQTNYKKFAAGPFDGKTLTLIDKEFVKNKWFAIDKRSFTIGGQKREATIYNRTEKSLLYKKHFDNYFESEAETINRIVELFRKEKTQTAEIVATLYFAWKELVTANTIISEDSLVKGFYQFHKEKKKFTEDQILLGYEYMMANELYPHSV
jgi:type I restriction enzyme, S subunit